MTFDSVDDADDDDDVGDFCFRLMCIKLCRLYHFL